MQSRFSFRSTTLRAALLALALLAAVPSGAHDWELVSGADHPAASAPSTSDDRSQVEIHARAGAIYVTSRTPVTVKVFSIVGQLISQATLPAGTSRLKVEARGIYILKAGPVTRRVSI